MGEQTVKDYKLRRQKIILFSIQLRELIKELGKDKSIEIMEQVTKSELEVSQFYAIKLLLDRQGGVFDPARAQRRLPGGVFIHYIRQRSDVDQEAIKNILDKHRSLSENSKKFKKRQNKLNSVAKENANAEKAADEAPMEAEVAPPNPEPQQIIVKEIEEPIVAANQKQFMPISFDFIKISSLQNHSYYLNSRKFLQLPFILPLLL